MFKRLVNPLKTRSFFLFGARGTGKSTFVKEQFLRGVDPVFTCVFDLLDPEREDRYSRKPGSFDLDLVEALKKQPLLKWVFVDEVQKAPKILNVIQKWMTDAHSKHIHFILSGSSARKLKRTGANLLAGRANAEYLFPLTAEELGEAMNLESVLKWGSLPEIQGLSDDREKEGFLKSYGHTYVREEIQQEQLIRKVDPFRNFLEITAQQNGQQVNLTKIGRDVGADHKTVEQYYQILEQTWLGFHLPSYHRSVRKAQRVHPKFYYFDPGVKAALDRTVGEKLIPGSSTFGEAFEHWMILEAFRHNQYRGEPYRLSFLRTKDDAEIDLILSPPGRVSQNEILIEIKSGERVDSADAARLERRSVGFNHPRLYLVSRDPHPVQFGNVNCIPWWHAIGEWF